MSWPIYVFIPENMKRNLEKTGGAVFSEKVLLALVDKGVSRDVAYRMVQPHALRWERRRRSKTRASADADIRRYFSLKRSMIYGT